MRVYVGITDHDWYQFLSARPAIDEVNFWQPSDLTITPDHRVRVSRRLKKDFDNGEHYYQLEESQLWIPARPEDRPNREFLEWHAETRFRG